MGIRGAALATVIGQIFGMLLGLWGVFRRQKVLNVNMREFKWRGQTIKDIYRVGLPGIVMPVSYTHLDVYKRQDED